MELIDYVEKEMITLGGGGDYLTSEEVYVLAKLLDSKIFELSGRKIPIQLTISVLTILDLWYSKESMSLKKLLHLERKSIEVTHFITTFANKYSAKCKRNTDSWVVINSFIGILS